jgi:hypothetical protein
MDSVSAEESLLHEPSDPVPEPSEVAKLTDEDDEEESPPEDIPPAFETEEESKLSTSPKTLRTPPSRNDSSPLEDPKTTATVRKKDTNKRDKIIILRLLCIEAIEASSMSHVRNRLLFLLRESRQ